MNNKDEKNGRKMEGSLLTILEECSFVHEAQ